MQARYPGTCAGCGAPIEVGEEIDPLPHKQWAHAACRAAATARLLPGAQRSDPGYAFTCPTCGAAPGEYCLSAAGKKASVHATRRGLSLPIAPLCATRLRRSSAAAVHARHRVNDAATGEVDDYGDPPS